MTTESRPESKFEDARLALFEAVGKPMTSVSLVDSRGRPVHTLQHGDGEARVFVHGGLGQSSEWAPLLGALPVDERYVLVDRPGCGLSYPIDYRGVDYREHAADFIEETLDALGVDQAHLVGNSMGGFFCLAFALRHPECIASLTLIGAPAGLSKYIPMPLRAMALPVLGNMMLGGDTTPAKLRKQVFNLLVADPSRISDAQLEAGILGNQIPGVVNASRTMLANAVSLTGWRRLIREEVAGLDVPIRFVWGSDDAFEPAGSGRQLAARMPNAEFVLVEDAGHLPWHDQPDACAAAIDEFWSASVRLAA